MLEKFNLKAAERENPALVLTTLILNQLHN